MGPPSFFKGGMHIRIFLKEETKTCVVCKSVLKITIFVSFKHKFKIIFDGACFYVC